MSVLCGTWKTLAVSILFLAPVSNGFVTPLMTSGGSAPVHKAALTGADTEPAHWALIFDCDGVILEVCRAFLLVFFSGPQLVMFMLFTCGPDTLRTYEQ